MVRTVEFAQRGFILSDRRELTQGRVSGSSNTVHDHGRRCRDHHPGRCDDRGGGQPLGIPQGSYWNDFGGGDIWISSGTQVYRLDLEAHWGEAFDLPEGVYAGGIAVDEATNVVWLSNFVP